MGVGASDVPPLPEGCAIVAVALPPEAGHEGHTRSGDAITQCCLTGTGVEGEEKCFGTADTNLAVDLIIKQSTGTGRAQWRKRDLGRYAGIPSLGFGSRC